MDDEIRKLQELRVLQERIREEWPDFDDPYQVTESNLNVILRHVRILLEDGLLTTEEVYRLNEAKNTLEWIQNRPRPPRLKIVDNSKEETT